MEQRSSTADTLAALLVEVITGVTGGAPERWAEVIGPVHQLPIVDNVRCNWTVIPGGTARERATIAKAVEVVRAEHPYVLE